MKEPLMFDLPADLAPVVRRRLFGLSGTMVGFDTETTGVDVRTARIVTAALVHLDVAGRQLPQTRSWLINPESDIPAAAVAIHGISTEHARKNGRVAREAVAEIIDALRGCWRAGQPTVIFNACYDLSLLDAEAARHHLLRVTELPEWPTAVIIDPLVIDRHVDQLRRGRRTLVAAGEHYGIPTPDAHDATGDSVAAIGVARAIAHRYPLINRAPRGKLRAWQQEWQRSWAVSLQSWLRDRGELEAIIDTGWPLRR